MALEYTAVADRSLDRLVSAVNRLIQHGWVPQGGIAFSVDANSKEESFVQALLKEDDHG